jgi:hypothetical protein
VCFQLFKIAKYVIFIEFGFKFFIEKKCQQVKFAFESAPQTNFSKISIKLPKQLNDIIDCLGKHCFVYLFCQNTFDKIINCNANTLNDHSLKVYIFMLLNSNSNYLLKLAKTDSDSH